VNLLAIDGGNSKTDLVLLDERGSLLARRRTSGSGGGPAHVATVVGGVLADLTHERLLVAPLTHCVATLAGLDFPEDAAVFRAALEAVLPGAVVVAENDAQAVLHAHGGDAVAVIYGAGFNVVARGPNGTAGHPALGWASGEWGGGGDLGREAVRLAYRSLDGRGPASVLGERVLAATGYPDEVSLSRAIRDGRPEAGVDRLAQVLLVAAAEGDAAAVGVVDRAVKEIVDLTAVIARRAFGHEIPAATPALLAGGVFGDEAFTTRVRDALSGLGLAAERFTPPPVLGAMHAVCGLAGIPVPTDLSAALEAAGPSQLERRPS
jgi:N-acetylglucosamine kinase-like BadF-type ATPase